MQNVLRRVFGAFEDLMPYVLLAIGALMSAAGAYLILTGSHIVQVEAGWTSVIAGATLFAGGILTIALSLVLRAITQLRSAMIGIPASLPSEPLSALALQSVAAALASPPPEPIAAVPEPAVPIAPPQKVEPSLGAASLSAWRRKKDAAPVPLPADAVVAREAHRPDEAPDPVTPADEAVAHEPAFAEAQAPAAISVPAAPVPAAPSPQMEESEVEVSEAVVHPAPLPDAAWDHEPVDSLEAPVALHEPETPVAASTRPKDDYAFEMPSTAEHDIETRPVAAAPVSPEPPASPPMDDWLDRAFADFDQDLPKVAPEKPPARTPLFRRPSLPKATMPPALPPLPPPLEPAYTHPEPAYAEPAAAYAESEAGPAEPPLSPTRPLTVPARPSITVPAAPPTIPAAVAPIPEEAAPPSAPPGPAATIIGRYEADGTSYVMYSDGSIEAQSDSGIYRFASMAELKAFIER